MYETRLYEISKIRFVIEEEYFDGKFVADESRDSSRKFRRDQRASNILESCLEPRKLYVCS